MHIIKHICRQIQTDVDIDTGIRHMLSQSYKLNVYIYYNNISKLAINSMCIILILWY